MDTFFTQKPEIDNVVERKERPYCDTMLLEEDTTFTLKTTSKAPLQKIKFFVDIIENYDEIVEKTKYYRIGKYYELEHLEQIQLFNSSGFYTITYTCTKVSDGNYDLNLSITHIEEHVLKAYISSIVFEDSFYTPDNAWLNPDNPDNMLEDIEDEKSIGLPEYPKHQDIVTYDGVSAEAIWSTPEEVTETLSFASTEKRGVVKIDGATITSSGGTISAVGGGYELIPDTEITTGVMINGKPEYAYLYQYKHTPAVMNHTLPPNLKHIHNVYGTITSGAGTSVYLTPNLPFNSANIVYFSLTGGMLQPSGASTTISTSIHANWIGTDMQLIIFYTKK